MGDDRPPQHPRLERLACLDGLRDADGVNPGDVEARVAALTDEEAARLAAGIDDLPAGGFVPVLIAFIVAATPIAIAVLLLPVVLVVGGVAIAASVVSRISKDAKQRTGDDAPVKAEGTSSPQN